MAHRKIARTKIPYYELPTRKLVFVTFIIVNIVLTIDITIVRNSSFLGGIYPLSHYLLIFIIIYFTYLAGTMIILQIIKREMQELRSNSFRFRLALATMFGIEFIIHLFIIVMIGQIITSQTYSIVLLEMVAYISFTLGASALGALAYKLYLWYRRNKSLILLLYLIGISLICVNSIVTVLLLNAELSVKPDKVQYRRSLSGAYVPESSVYAYVRDLTLMASFPFVWLATMAVMKNYSTQRGSIKFWIIMGISFVYFFGQFQPFFYSFFHQIHLFDTTIGRIGYTVFIDSARPLAGILFGIVFWLLSKIIVNSATKGHLLVAGFGIMLIFATNQSASVIITPLPPFGIITSGLFGLAACLLYIGLYTTAVSVAHDVNIRKQIKSFARQLIVLDKIGTPELNQQTESLVMNTIKELETETKNFEEISGVSASLEPADMKDYLKQVMEELKQKKGI